MPAADGHSGGHPRRLLITAKKTTKEMSMEEYTPVQAEFLEASHHYDDARGSGVVVEKYFASLISPWHLHTV